MKRSREHRVITYTGVTKGWDEAMMATCVAEGTSEPQIHDAKWAQAELRERGILPKRRKLSRITTNQLVALTEALVEAEERDDYRDSADCEDY